MLLALMLVVFGQRFGVGTELLAALFGSIAIIGRRVLHAPRLKILLMQVRHLLVFRQLFLVLELAFAEQAGQFDPVDEALGRRRRLLLAVAVAVRSLGGHERLGRLCRAPLGQLLVALQQVGNVQHLRQAALVAATGVGLLLAALRLRRLGRRRGALGQLLALVHRLGPLLHVLGDLLCYRTLKMKINTIDFNS